MEFIEQSIKGVYIVALLPKADERGFFMRTYDADIFNEIAPGLHWVQENHSLTKSAGTIRGLHFQLPPFTESKLVRCIRGNIYDVYVDLRTGSPDFGRWGAVELSGNTFTSLFLPKGFAHGFCTLSDQCEVQYKVDSKYSPDHDCGIRWNDADLNISWPVTRPVLSHKDAVAMSFTDFINTYQSLTV